jgi:hypothetical protein
MASHRKSTRQDSIASLKKKYTPLWTTPTFYSLLTRFLLAFNPLFTRFSLRRTASKPATSKASSGSRFPYKQE